MTEKPERPHGGSVKTVRKRLADGTIREYHYDRTKAGKVRLRQHGAIRQIAELYVKSPEFAKLSARWQANRRYYLGILEDELDWMTVDDLNDRQCRGDFYEIRDQFVDTPDKADKLLDSLKGLLGWAYERNRIAYNHAVGIPHLAKSGKRRNEIVWTEDHEAIVYASFPPELVEAFRFALFSAMRLSDLVALKASAYRDGWITYKQSKTGAWVYLPVYALPPFQELVEGLDRSGDLMLPDVGCLRSRWRKALSRSPLKDEDLHWHDLRGTATTRLLEAHCTDAEVAAITGHSIGPGTKLGDYAARSKQLALHAYQKWAAHMAERPQVIAFGNRAGNR
jgi:integrase